MNIDYHSIFIGIYILMLIGFHIEQTRILGGRLSNLPPSKERGKQKRQGKIYQFTFLRVSVQVPPVVSAVRWI